MPGGTAGVGLRYSAGMEEAMMSLPETIAWMEAALIIERAQDFAWALLMVRKLTTAPDAPASV